MYTYKPFDCVSNNEGSLILISSSQSIVYNNYDNILMLQRHLKFDYYIDNVLCNTKYKLFYKIWVLA